MKKLLALLCSLTMVISLAACGSSGNSASSAPAAASSAPAASAAASQSAEEASAYQEKNVSLIIPYSAGGDADNMFRCLEPVMDQYLNGNVIVGEIVSGGNAIPGTQQALDAGSDGYTLTIAYPGNICIQPNMGNASYAYEDLQAVACITASPVLFAVNENAPYDDLASWVEWVKANPGKFTYCTGSLGGTPHLAMAKMLAALGIQDDVVYVPYSGNAEAYAAVAGGQIDGYASVASGVVGKEMVKPIGNLGTVAVSAHPDLQTLEDIGVNMSQATDVFCGFACSSGVDDAIVQQLSDAFGQAMENPEVQENLKNMNYTANYLSADEFQEYLDANYEAYAAVIQELGLAQ